MLGTVTKAYPVQGGTWDVFMILDDGREGVTSETDEHLAGWEPQPGDRINLKIETVYTLTRA